MRLLLFRTLTAERRGSVAVMIAVMAAVLIAVASLAVEIGMALKTQRQMQLAADDAATAAMSAELTNFPLNWQQEGYGAADGNGFGGSSWGKPPDCLSVTAATRPWIYVGVPCDGPHTGNSDYVEAFLEMDFPLRLAKVLFGNNFVLHGRAVATSTTITGCVAVLDPTDPKSLWLNGTSVQASMQGCDIFVDSNAAGAAQTSGNPTLTCDKMYVGGTSIPDPITSGCPTVENAQPVGDPYQNVQVPTTPSCAGAKSATVKMGVQPGCYTDITVKNGTMGLCPGLYIINGQNGVSAQTTNATLKSLSNDPTQVNNYDASFSTHCPGNTGSGVTIVLTGSSPSKIGQVSFTAQANIYLTAQKCSSTNCTVNGVAYPTGIPSEMLFYQDRSASTATCQPPGKNLNNFQAGSTQVLEGILYFPSGCVNYQGSSTSTVSCFQIISWTLGLAGGAILNASLCSPFSEKIQPVLLAE